MSKPLKQKVLGIFNVRVGRPGRSYALGIDENSTLLLGSDDGAHDSVEN